MSESNETKKDYQKLYVNTLMRIYNLYERNNDQMESHPENEGLVKMLSIENGVIAKILNDANRNDKGILETLGITG